MLHDHVLRRAVEEDELDLADFEELEDKTCRPSDQEFLKLVRHLPNRPSSGTLFVVENSAFQGVKPQIKSMENFLSCHMSDKEYASLDVGVEVELHTGMRGRVWWEGGALVLFGARVLSERVMALRVGLYIVDAPFVNLVVHPPLRSEQLHGSMLEPSGAHLDVYHADQRAHAVRMELRQEDKTFRVAEQVIDLACVAATEAGKRTVAIPAILLNIGGVGKMSAVFRICDKDTGRCTAEAEIDFMMKAGVSSRQAVGPPSMIDISASQFTDDKTTVLVVGERMDVSVPIFFGCERARNVRASPTQDWVEVVPPVFLPGMVVEVGIGRRQPMHPQRVCNRFRFAYPRS